jgi:hypothetical protein
MVPMAGRLSIVVTTICKQPSRTRCNWVGGPAWLLCRMRNFRHSDGRVGRRIDARDVTLQRLSSLRAVRSTHEDRLTDEGKAPAEVLVCANLERRHDSRPNHRDAEGSRGFHLPRSAGCGFWPVAELACCARWAVIATADSQSSGSSRSGTSHRSATQPLPSASEQQPHSTQLSNSHPPPRRI